ncbi:DUF6844 domain-containing protein [Shewanella sedimentimangrovi]|uniref:DUF6844 domain-containing protein n=1 Tax=Shewanella sedimentimangrovi TaxID=2814293 RepID=A0ABX7R093_9GAMM|nr:hypothetical protein [Shewanella sedimentimangrovi]QSX37197.1 hypothetical protein JYB85_18445 [Shewanella sedimentimangrovi]
MILPPQFTRTLLSLTTTLFLFSAMANSEEQVVTEAEALSSAPTLTKEEVVAAKEQGLDDAYQYVSELAQEFVTSKMTQFAGQNKQVHLHFGTALVAAKPTEAGWSDSRIMAYQGAQLQARESLLKQLHRDVTSETLRTSFKTNKLPEFTAEELQSQDRLEAILDKVVTLVDATLDSKLNEMGIDAAEYSAAPPSKRKVMMQKAITRTAKQRARGDISGSQIMKSYEATDKNGNTAIAVVIATSVKKKNFLASLRLSKGNIEPSPEKAGEPLNQYLARQKNNLVYQYGTKLLWDEKGYPMLVSFGMSGNDCNPSDYEECVDNREFSFGDAELDALAHIAEGYSLMGTFESERSNTEHKTRTATATQTQSKETDVNEDTVAEIIKEISESSSMRSSVKGLVGVKTAMRWTEKHPITNREVNGVVLVWHPRAEQDTRTFKEGKIIEKKSNAAKASIRSGVGESEEAANEEF